MEKYPFTLSDKTFFLERGSLTKYNTSTHIALDHTNKGFLDFVVSDKMVENICTILVCHCLHHGQTLTIFSQLPPISSKLIYMTPHSESDLIALWIVQKPKSWLALPAIPRRTEVVICFRITTNRYWVRKDLAFFLANLHRSLYSNRSKTVSLSSISFMADGFQTIGFAAYKNMCPA